MTTIGIDLGTCNSGARERALYEQLRQLEAAGPARHPADLPSTP